MIGNLVKALDWAHLIQLDITVIVHCLQISEHTNPLAFTHIATEVKFVRIVLGYRVHSVGLLSLGQT